MKRKVFAHRGSSGKHPENTLAAIRDAIDAGADGIEIDVQKTKDGKMAVIHDEAVDRTTDGTGFIKDRLLEEVKRLDAGAGERIPELREVLEVMQGTTLKLNIELKNDSIEYSDLEKDVYQEIEKFDMIEQVIISSFNHQSLKRFSKLAPDVELAVLTEEPLDNPDQYLKDIGAASIHCDWPSYQKMRETAAGLSYRIFTLNQMDEIRRWAEQADYDIFTDFPGIALEMNKNASELI